MTNGGSGRGLFLIFWLDCNLLVYAICSIFIYFGFRVELRVFSKFAISTSCRCCRIWYSTSWDLLLVHQIWNNGIKSVHFTFFSLIYFLSCRNCVFFGFKSCSSYYGLGDSGMFRNEGTVLDFAKAGLILFVLYFTSYMKHPNICCNPVIAGRPEVISQ